MRSNLNDVIVMAPDLNSLEIQSHDERRLWLCLFPLIVTFSLKKVRMGPKVSSFLIL